MPQLFRSLLPTAIITPITTAATAAAVTTTRLLQRVDLLAKLLDRIILGTVLLLLTESLIEVVRRGERADECGNQRCDDECFLKGKKKVPVWSAIDLLELCWFSCPCRFFSSLSTVRFPFLIDIYIYHVDSFACLLTLRLFSSIILA